MTTNEFIKMLQKADPSGNTHIRIDGRSIPVYAEYKDGYWDGPYSYKDENGNWVYSTKGSKIDIYCEDIDDFVYGMFGKNKIPKFEEVSSKFKFELDNYCIESQRKEKENIILKEAKESYDDCIKLYEEVITKKKLNNKK